MLVVQCQYRWCNVNIDGAFQQMVEFRGTQPRIIHMTYVRARYR